MLDFMRRNARGWVVRITLAVIAVVFIFFMGGGGQIGGGATAIATVGDEQISALEFEQTWRRNEAFYREQYGERLTPQILEALDLPSVTLNQLVDSAVLRGEASRLGLRVPDEAVRSEIREMGAFQVDGQFSPATYRAALQNRGMSPAVFEDSLRNDILVEQLVDVVRKGVHVTEDEAFEQWAREAEEIVLSYVRLPAEDFEDDVTVDEEALTSYFDDHAEDYRKPEAVRVRYVAYTPSKLASDADATDEAVEEYYVLHEDEFEREETVSARHILKTVDAEGGEEAKAAAREAIEKVKARLDAGEDFAKVAEEESQDPGSAKSGGDLGAFGRGKMVPPFEEAAFALQPGQTSGIVESSFGFHIIHVYDRQEAGVRPLDEVRDDIARKLKETAAAERAFDLAAADALEVREGRSDLDKVAASRGLEIRTTEMISKGDVVPEVGAAPAFVDAALGLQENATSDPVRAGDTYYLLQFAERRESRVPELSEVREEVERDYRREQARELASRKASEMIEALESGKTLADVASAQGLEVADTESFPRRGPFVPGLGTVAGLKDVAFQTKEDGEVLPRPFPHESEVYVFVRKSFEPASREEFAEMRDDVIAAVRRQKEETAVSEFVRTLKENTDISFNKALLDRYLAPQAS